MRISAIGLAAVMLATAGAATAQTLPSGFYLRGDLGGGFAQSVTFTDVSPTALNCDLCAASLPASVDDSVLFGGGIGYRFSPLLRADVTVDDLPSLRVTGTSTQVPPATGSAPLSSLVVMANGYVDLAGVYPGSFGLIQPYVTGGVGFVRNDLGTFSGTVAGLPLSETGHTTTNFAWGAGAGIGYPISPNVTLDIGYKFLNLGSLQTGTVVTLAGAALPPVTASKSDDLGVHTVTASLRVGF